MTDNLHQNYPVETIMPTRNRFDFFWQLDIPLFEPPNYSRGGWSNVSQLSLLFDNGEQIPVFIKRQYHHLTRQWRYGLKRIPTFQREYLNIQQLQALNIPTLEAVFFAKRKYKAILITKALFDFQSLDQLDHKKLSFAEKRALIAALAEIIAKLHARHLQHNCLYPKHIFVRQQDNCWDIRLIDLEKLRRKIFKRQAIKRDLSCLLRHTAPNSWSLTEHMHFFKVYLNQERLCLGAKKLWRQIAAKADRKRH